MQQSYACNSKRQHTQRVGYVSGEEEGKGGGASCLDDWAEHWRHTGKVGDEWMNHSAAAALQAAVHANDLICGQASKRHVGRVANDEPLHDQAEGKHVTQRVVLAGSTRGLHSRGEILKM